MKTHSMAMLCLLLVFLFPVPSSGGTLAGVTMEDSINSGDRSLSLIGMGVRNKFIVKVYVAGLYLSGRERSQEAVIHADQAKALRMRFLYDKVDPGKLQDAWRKGFEKNTPDASADLKERMARFVSLFTEDARKGDEYLFLYRPGKGTEITIGGRQVGVIVGADFAGALMAIWFGDHPADKGLKRSILESGAD